VGNDTEVWLLGIAALIGGVWHMAHAAIISGAG
jgi:hypothetical protein